MGFITAVCIFCDSFLSLALPKLLSLILARSRPFPDLNQGFPLWRSFLLLKVVWQARQQLVRPARRAPAPEVQLAGRQRARQGRRRPDGAGALPVHRAVPPEQRVRAGAAGERHHLRAQEEGGRVVQGDAAEDGPHRPLPGQFRGGVLSCRARGPVRLCHACAGLFALECSRLFTCNPCWR